jgi:hypothetical protein
MGDEKKAKGKKPGKKLELNKETVQELSDTQLDDVAGGIDNSIGICKGGEKPVGISERRFVTTVLVQCPEHPS